MSSKTIIFNGIYLALWLWLWWLPCLSVLEFLERINQAFNSIINADVGYFLIFTTILYCLHKDLVQMLHIWIHIDFHILLNNWFNIRVYNKWLCMVYLCLNRLLGWFLFYINLCVKLLPLPLLDHWCHGWRTVHLFTT